MRINEGEVNRLSKAVVTALLKQGYIHPNVPEQALVERIAALVLDNLKAEDAIERDAEQLAEKHARQMAGLDHRKIVLGIKARLAKERGFAL